MRFFSFFVFLVSLNSLASTISRPSASIVTSGGVSKGAYQAGFLYYANALVSKNADTNISPNVFAGTSAGGINSLITILNSCSDSIENVTDSVNYKFWYNGGLENIYDKKLITENKLFKLPPESISMMSIRQKWFQGIKKNCKAYLGLTFTHLDAKRYKVNELISSPHMKEFIALEIVGNGYNKAPSIKTINLDKDNNFYIPFDGSDKEKYDVLENLIYATSAFPIAFEPKEIQYCYVKKSENNCKEVAKDYFVDGGLFNNTPVSLAFKIQEEIGSKTNNFLVVDSDQHIYRIKDSPSEKNKKYNLTDLTSNLFLNFIDVSQKADLTEFARMYESTNNRAYTAITNLPTASEPMFHFWGLFDRDFRSYDFYLGMNDAREFFTSNKNLKFKNEPIFDDLTNRKLNCLKDFSNCHRVEDKNFLILLQTSIFKIYDMCADKLRKEDVFFSKYCHQVNESKVLPNVYDQKVLDFHNREGEGELEYTLRLLHAQGYKFTYLKHDDSVESLLSEVRDILREMITEISSKQDSESFSMVKLVKKNMFDYLLFYEPMNNFWYLNIGKLVEIGYRAHPESWKWLSRRLTISASTLLQSSHVTYDGKGQSLSYSLLGGIYYQLPYWESSKHQLNIFSKAGYQFSTGDKFGQKTCHGSDNVLACSTTIYQAGIGVTLFDHFGLSYAATYYKKPHESGFVLDPTLLVGFNFKFD